MLDAATNPLLPTVGDSVWFALAIVLFVAAVAAVLSISRRARQLGAAPLVLWLAFVVLVPLVGPTLWFAVGRRASDVPNS